MVTQAPREPHTLDARLPVSPEGGLRLLSGKIRGTVGNHVKAIVLGLSMLVASNGQVKAANDVPSALSAVADKGGQIAGTLNGEQITFHRLMGMDSGAEKDGLIDNMSEELYAKYEDYLKSTRQTAINQNEQKREVLVASNQEADKIAEQRQVANQTLKVDQQKLIADAIVYMQKVEHGDTSVNPAIIQNILKIEEKTPGVIPATLLEWARGHATTTVASIAGR